MDFAALMRYRHMCMNQGDITIQNYLFRFVIIVKTEIVVVLPIFKRLSRRGL